MLCALRLGRFHYIPKDVLVTKKVKTKMDAKYTNRVPESRSLRVLGVSESGESQESQSLKP